MSATLLLMGCSSYDPTANITVKWEDGKILYKGKDTGLTEYKGYEASADRNGEVYHFILNTDTATAANISVNYQGVEEANMDKLKGKLYYTEYMGTKLTMAHKVADKTFTVGQVGLVSSTKELAAQFMSDYLDSFRLTNGYSLCDFGPFIFGSGYENVKVTTEGASIPATAKVTKTSVGCDIPMEVVIDEKGNTKSMMTKETEGYTYYEYEGFTIQLAKGLQFSTYVKIK